jgi:hypothetical protein
MLNVKYLLESRREGKGPPIGSPGKKGVLQILIREQKATASGRG